MKWSDEMRVRVLDALSRRLPDQRLGMCSICGAESWRMTEAFVTVAASSSLTGRETGTEPTPTLASQDMMLPFAALACTNCGNTHFLNLLLLGLGDLLTPEAEAMATLDADPVLLPPDTREAEKK